MLFKAFQNIPNDYTKSIFIVFFDLPHLWVFWLGLVIVSLTALLYSLEWVPLALFFLLAGCSHSCHFSTQMHSLLWCTLFCSLTCLFSIVCLCQVTTNKPHFNYIVNCLLFHCVFSQTVEIISSEETRTVVLTWSTDSNYNNFMLCIHCLV